MFLSNVRIAVDRVLSYLYSIRTLVVNRVKLVFETLATRIRVLSFTQGIKAIRRFAVISNYFLKVVVSSFVGSLYSFKYYLEVLHKAVRTMSISKLESKTSFVLASTYVRAKLSVLKATRLIRDKALDKIKRKLRRV